MDIYNSYNQLSVKISCRNSGGSGVLIQPMTDQFTYVLTAKHCLEGTVGNKQSFETRDIQVTRRESDGSWTEFRVIDHRLHLQADLAVILIEKIEIDSENPCIVEKKYRSKVTIYGYPGALNKHPDNPRESLDGEIVRLDNNHLEIRNMLSPGTFNHGDDHFIVGFSGSGIYVETVDRKLALAGIFTSLKENKGAYNILVGESMDAMYKFLDDCKLPSLALPVPYYMVQKLSARCRYLHEWAQEKRLNLSPWIEFERSPTLISAIQSHLLSSDDLSVLHIVGRSGVGKTRAVLKACLERQELQSVLYFDSYSALDHDTKEKMKYSSTFFKLIVDDITLEQWEQLNNEFANFSSQIRIISIGVVPENRLSSRLGILPIVTPTDDDVIALMQIIDPSLGEDSCRLLMRLCEKDLRLVILLLSTKRTNPEALGPINQIGIPIMSVESLMNRILQQFQDELGDISVFKRLYTYLCLFVDIGYKESYRSELEYLAQYFGCRVTDLNTALSKAIRCTLGIDRSEFFEASPRVFARLFFENEGWLLVKDDLSSFMNGMPTTLMQKRFINRAEECSGAVREEVQVALAAWFRETFPTFELGLIDDVEKAKIFKVYTEFSPSSGIAWLKNSVSRAGGDGLLKFEGAGGFFGSNKSRRYIVWLCEHLACFGEHFWDCEYILFLLAQHETENHISNNSKGIWTGLFTPVLSNTEVPFIPRFERLMSRLTESNSDNIELICAAIMPIFNTRYSKMAPPNVVGGRIVPAQWEPSSFEELTQLTQWAMQLLLTSIAQLQGDTLTKAVDFLIGNLATFIDYGNLQTVKDFLHAVGITESQTRNVKLELERYINRIVKFNHTDIYKEQVSEWRNQYLPQGLESTFVDFICRNYWDYFHATDEQTIQQETEELASALVENKIDLEKYIDLISSKDIDLVSISYLADRIGFHDKSEHYKAFVSKMLGQNQAVTFGMAYLSGQSLRQKKLPAWASEELDRLKTQFPISVLEITSSVDISEVGYERIISILTTSTADVHQILYKLQYRDWGEFLSQEQKIVLFETILKYLPEQNSLQLILRLVCMWDLERKEVFEERFIGILLNVLTKCLLSEGWFQDWDWNEVIKKVPEKYVQQKCELLVIALVKRKSGHSQLDDYALSHIKNLGNKHTKIILDCLSEVLKHKEFEMGFYLNVYRGLFESMDINSLKEWIEAQGVERARLTARHIASPAPTKEEPDFVPPLTWWLLEKFEADERFFNEFLAGRHSYEVYSVEEKLNQHDSLVASLQPYLEHRLRLVQEWAKYEIRNSEFIRDDHKRREARLDRE